MMSRRNVHATAERIKNQKVECIIMEENTMDFLKDEPISKILYQNTNVPYLMTLEPLMQSMVEGECAVSYSSNRYMEFNKIGVDKIYCLGDVLYHGPRNNLPQSYSPKDVAELFNEIKEKGATQRTVNIDIFELETARKLSTIQLVIDLKLNDNKYTQENYSIGFNCSFNIDEINELSLNE